MVPRHSVWQTVSVLVHLCCLRRRIGGARATLSWFWVRGWALAAVTTGNRNRNCRLLPPPPRPAPPHCSTAPCPSLAWPDTPGEVYLSQLHFVGLTMRKVPMDLASGPGCPVRIAAPQAVCYGGHEVYCRSYSGGTAQGRSTCGLIAVLSRTTY